MPISAYAEWWSRQVSDVDGTFGPITPTYGNEVGIGTSHIEWGVPNPGEMASFMTWEGYDKYPNQDQEWYWQGDVVNPGWTFLAGYLTIGNGELNSNSSTYNLETTLNVRVFGSEFYIDNHPLLAYDTWKVSIRQTDNKGVDQVADADYVFFPDFPHLGSFRVFEDKVAKFPVYAKFGSVEPVAIGPAVDPSTGVVVKSVVNDPTPPPTSIIIGGTAHLDIKGVNDSGLSAMFINFSAYSYEASTTTNIVSAPSSLWPSEQYVVSVDATSTTVGHKYIDVMGNGMGPEIVTDPNMPPMPTMIHLSAYGAFDVLDHSAAVFADGSQVLDLDFGDIQLGSGLKSLEYQFKNLPAEFRAGLDLDGITEVADSGGVFNTDPFEFENLSSGKLSSLYNLFLDPTKLGEFSGQYRFDLSDQKDLNGHAGAQTLILNVTANVVPEPCTFVLLSMSAFGLSAWSFQRGRKAV